MISSSMAGVPSIRSENTVAASKTSVVGIAIVDVGEDS